MMRLVLASLEAHSLPWEAVKNRIALIAYDQKIQVESKPGVGTRFWFELPLVEEVALKSS